MQRIHFVLTLILLGLVIYLLVERPGCCTPTDGKANFQTEAESGGLSIAYVNVDTLLNNFGVFKTKQKDISERELAEDTKLRNRGKAIEREIQALQNKAMAGTMTPKDLSMEEERLVKKQQEFLADQERITKALMEESLKINEELQNEIVKAIQKIQQEKGFHYVLSHGAGSPVLGIHPAFDITDDVLTILNSTNMSK